MPGFSLMASCGLYHSLGTLRSDEGDGNGDATKAIGLI